MPSKSFPRVIFVLRYVLSKSSLRILKVLSEPKRIEILRRIVEIEAETTTAVTCSDVQCGIGVAQSTLSHHIAELADVDLVLVHQSGRFNHLKINRPAYEAFVKEMAALLD